MPRDTLLTQPSNDSAFLEQPRGRHVVGESFAYFCVDETFCGFGMWGVPTAAEVKRLGRLISSELRPNVQPHFSLVQLSQVERVDVEALDALRTYVEENAPGLSANVLAQAMVHGSKGLSAMIVAGFAHVHPPPYPMRAFPSTEEATTWLFPARPELAGYVEALLDVARGLPAVVTQLHAVLDRTLATATLVNTAATLGWTARTLQRKLHDAGTTFQQEYADAQLNKAKRLLVESDTKIAAIALAVGFSSPSHFSQQFRKMTGYSPQDFRLRR